MTTPPLSPEQGESVLQHRFSLVELLDLGSFRELCESYAQLFQIGFKIFDDSKALLVDVKGSGGDFCAYLFSHPEGKSRCMREVATIRGMELTAAGPVEHVCFTGLRYLLVPILHEGSVLGKIVFGPYRAAQAVEPALSGLGEKFSQEAAQRLLDKVRQAKRKVVDKVVGHLVLVIESILHVGYKQALTARVHVEASTAGYAELQEKNRELRESYQRLKELDRLKSNFLATVSHELRTPLTSVIGYSEMLLEGLAGELSTEQREYVSTIMEKGEQLLDLITSILDFSRIEAGNLRLNQDQVDINEIVLSSVSTVMPMARKSGISVDCAVTETPLRLRIDGDKIRQVLVNLLGNAVKFSREKGLVRVQVGTGFFQADDDQNEGLPAALSLSQENFVTIAVSDSGPGIAPDKLNRIFDSFYQVDGSSTREHGGTGLGLAIARNLVEAHQGKIEVKSEPNRGSTFTVFLPLADRG